MTYLQTAIDFSVHQRERTEEGTAHVQKNALKFSNDCKKLIRFWQSHRGYWLSNEDGRTFGISSYLSARVYDIIQLGIAIDKKVDGNIKRFTLKCTCHHVHGERIDTGCYLHSEELRIVT